MSPVTRPFLAWLLALVMPFQALLAVYLDVRGPAHFHVAGGGERHVHEDARASGPGRGHEFSHVIAAMGLAARVHGPTHAHGHQHDVDRHHHHPGDPSVVTIDDHGLSGSLALKEETTSGWSSAMLVTLPASGLSPAIAAGLRAPAPRTDPLLQTRTPGRLDRPPRAIPS